MLDRLHHWLTPEPPWIRPAVSTVEAEGELRALLVYHQWVDMFWGAHSVLPVDQDPTALQPAFWHPPAGDEPRYRIRNAWTGAWRETFPAGVAWRHGERAARVICLRSVHPMRGRRVASLRAERRTWRLVLEAQPDIVKRAQGLLVGRRRNGATPPLRGEVSSPTSVVDAGSYRSGEDGGWAGAKFTGEKERAVALSDDIDRDHLAHAFRADGSGEER